MRVFGETSPAIVETRYNNVHPCFLTEPVQNAMQSLPLFPLNTVLFPGMPITLHIFEERYKLMINECVRGHQPFGIVLLKSGSEVKGLNQDAEPYNIGCTALIAQTQPLGSGRMNIVAIGQERFQISQLDRSQAYLVGDTEPFPLANPDPPAFSRAITRLRPWIDRYLAILEKTENVRIAPRQLPEDELPLAYLAASLLKVGLSEKQDLLSVDTALDLADRVRMIYRKEVTLSDIALLQPETEYRGPFSTN